MPLKLSQDELPTINLTSMIDVLFLLIIFFMVGTRFTEEESNIKINLAKVAPSGAMIPSPSSKVVFIASDGSIQFNGQRVSTAELTNLLAVAVRNYPDTSVQIKSDEELKLKQISSVVSAVKLSGARMVDLTMASVQMPGQTR